MRIIIVGINYEPEIISTAVYTTGMAEDMVANGVEIEVVTAKPYFPAWRVFDGFRSPWWKSRKSQSGIQIVHCPLYVPRKPSGLRRILHNVTFAISIVPPLLLKSLMRRPDVIMLIAPSIACAPSVLWIARLRGAKTWLHIQDFEVEAAFATDRIKKNSRVGQMARRFETWAIGKFDRVSTISDQMLAKARSKGVQEGRLVEFRNWADLAKVKPIEGISPLKAELGIDTKFVALYSGNLANKQGLEILPLLARHLAHRTDLTIAICGDGPMRLALEKMSQGIPSIRFFPLQPVEKISALLGMADIHLLPQIAEAADLVLPSKLTNMLASGRPVVATANLDTSLGREVEGAGVLVPPGDATAFAVAVDDLLNDPARRMNLGEKARQRAVERWDMNVILSRLRQQLATLSNERFI